MKHVALIAALTLCPGLALAADGMIDTMTRSQAAQAATESAPENTTDDTKALTRARADMLQAMEELVVTSDRPEQAEDVSDAVRALLDEAADR